MVYIDNRCRDLHRINKKKMFLRFKFHKDICTKTGQET